MISSQHKLPILMLIFMLSGSCRPPNLGEDAMNNTSRMGDEEVHPQHTGQSPPIQLEYDLDPRPDFIRAADNPDYDRTAGAFGRMWNAIFEGPSASQPDPNVSTFPPPPDNGQIDAYDLHSGRVRVDPTVDLENDPEVQEMRRRQAEFQEEMKAKQKLSDQRNYLEGKAKEDIQRFNQKKIDGFSKDILKQIGDLKGEIDASIVEHNKFVDQLIHDEVKVVEGEGPSGYQFKTSANTINGQKVRSAQYGINSAQKSVSQMSGAAR